MRSMQFKDVIHNLKTLRIQSADHVAREGIQALLLVLKESHVFTREALVAELFYARNQLIEARPTEPCLRNALSYVFNNVYSYDDDHALYKGMTQRVREVIHYFDTAQKRIASLGAAKIRHHSVVFTHCHSSSVVHVLQQAKKQGKVFLVYNTETRPMWQGRQTATELAKAKIPVTHFVDSAAGVAMQDAHLCLMGCDAITPYFIYNKIGSGIFAELLHTRKIPLYICSNSWKFDPTVTKKHHEIIEERDSAEVWSNPPKGVKVENPVFEAIPLQNITSIISELGVLSPVGFIQAVKHKHVWMQNSL